MLLLVMILSAVMFSVNASAEPQSKTNAKVETPDAARLSSYLLPEPKVLEPFELLDHNHQVFDREQLSGKWSLIFFGYTYCPDICPTALTILQEIFDNLGGKPGIIANLQGIFISMDPQRDSLKVLKRYVTYFNPGFIGLTGDESQVAEFSGQFGARYSKFYSWQSEGEYLIDHTASLYLVDPQVRHYAVFPPPYGPQKITEFLSRSPTR